MAYRKVVVAVDGSSVSEVALRRAVAIARTSGARLAVLGVEEPVPPFADAATWGRQNGHVHAVVQAATEAARQAVVSADGEVEVGYPADVIVRYCAEQACDLVVVGANDRGAGPLGPTADKVVDLVGCAVLVTR